MVFQKGNKINVGKKMSNETKEKIRNKAIGRKFSNRKKEYIFTEDHKKKLSISHKGNIPWNKGRHGFIMSEEQKHKLSIALKGRKIWNKGLKGIKTNNKGKIAWNKGLKTGKPAWNYIDGRSKLVGPDRYGDDWSFIRKIIFRRDNFTCQKCFKNNNISLDVHHIIPFLDGGSNELNNLLSLCRSCHRKVEAEIMRKIKNI